MTRLTFLLAIVSNWLACVAAESTPLLLPIAPGVCSHNGAAGVGCTYDFTKLTVGGITVAPKSVAVKQKPCPWWCYGLPNLPGCPASCTAHINFGTDHKFAFPSTAQLEPATEASSCFESASTHTPLSYEEDIWKNTSHHSFFHSHSSQTHWYYKVSNSTIIHNH